MRNLEGSAAWLMISMLAREGGVAARLHAHIRVHAHHDDILALLAEFGEGEDAEGWIAAEGVANWFVRAANSRKITTSFDAAMRHYR